MGHTSFRDSDWSAYAATTKSKKVDDIYKGRSIHTRLDPKNIAIRESRDSSVSPQSTALILALDVSGSMGILAENIAKSGFGVVFSELIKRAPITNPHVMISAFGDLRHDRSPLQMTQFESGVPEMTAQLEQVYLEGGGGNNQSESDDLVWYSAFMLTSIDCMEKRQKKGYLFTIGDENAPVGINRAQLESKCGIKVEGDITAEEALELAQRKYDVYHIIVEQGSHCRRFGVDNVMKTWTPLLGQNVLRLSAVDNLAEVIVSTIEVAEGKDVDAVVGSWSGSTAVAVKHAVSGLQKKDNGSSSAVVRF